MLDSPWANAEFARKYNLEFELLSDLNREAVQAYDAAFVGLGGIGGYMCANRVVIIIDGNGTVQYRWVAENPGLNRTTPKWFQPLQASESKRLVRKRRLLRPRYRCCNLRSPDRFLDACS